MVWEISITAEGWQEIEERLNVMSKKDLVAALADDDYEAWEYDETGPNDVDTVYAGFKARYSDLAQDTLAYIAYERVQLNNTCDNGGWAYWIDRKGYHTVKMGR